MMRSMFTGVAGLRTHQTKMDVIGNNIANVNTVGYKASSVTFREIYSQTIQGASSPNADTGRGGTNPLQIGLGVAVASIDNLMTQGAAQTTDNPLDLMINGNSFFIVGDSSTGYYFTRAGAFRLDQDGNLVNPAGLRVYGWNASEDEKNPGQQKIVKGKVQPLVIKSPQNMYIQPEVTKNASFEGNINMEEGLVDGIVKAVDFFDSLGNHYKLEYTLIYNEQARAWVMTPASTMIRNDNEDDIINVAGLVSTIIIKFNIDGTIQTTGSMRTSTKSIMVEVGGTPAVMSTNAAGDPVEVTPAVPGRLSNQIISWDVFVPEVPPKTSFNIPHFSSDVLGVDAQTNAGGISVDLKGMTQFQQKTTVKGMSLDGCSSGEMTGFSIGPSGVITATYSNGRMKVLGQIAVASFKNPAGLEKVGDNLFANSPNSGVFDGMGEDPTVGGGSIGGGRLEMSNVDLSREFTEMITTQRGFQANARVITTSDEMLQELVRLK